MTDWLAYDAGDFRPLDQVSIALNDAGFVYGATVTDQCRTYRQQLFQLAEHVQRFRQSCSLCEIDAPWSDLELATAVVDLVKRNRAKAAPDAEWTVVWVATGGPVGSFLGEPGSTQEAMTRLIAYAFPLPFARFRTYYQTGAEVRLARPPDQVPDACYPRHAKHRSRLSWWIAERETRAVYPHAQVLFSDEGVYLTETSSANLLLVMKGAVYSPPLARILPGISLRVVQTLCALQDIPFVHADLRPADLAAADEAMLCSTPYGIAPVGNLDGRPLSVNGPVFEKLLVAWNEVVGLDIRAQFLQPDP